jgi:hypothetical protein
MLRNGIPIGMMLILSSGLTACSKSDPAASATSGAAVTAFKNLTSTMNKLAVTSAAGAASGRLGFNQIFSGSSLASWTTASMGDPRNSGGSCQYTSSISPQDFMKIDTNKNSVRCNGSSVNVFGRIQTAFSVACAFAHMIPDIATSADLPASGSKTYTMDSSQFATMVANCPGLQLDDVTSLSFAMTFTTPADTTNFDRSFSGTATFDTSAGSQSASLDTVMLKFNSSITAVAMKEHNGNGSTRTVVIHDLANNQMKAEYLSGPNSSVTLPGSNTLHRLFYDGVNHYGRIYSSINTYSNLSQAGSSPQAINAKYVMTANPDDLTQAGSIGMTFTSGVSTVTLNACLTISSMDGVDGGTVTSGKFSCSGMEGVATSLMTVDASTWDFVRANVDSWEALNSAPTLSWSKDNMYIQVPAQY